MNEGPSGDLQAAVNMLAMAKGHIRGGTAPSRTTDDDPHARDFVRPPAKRASTGYGQPGRIRKLVERQVKASLERQDRARVEKEKAKSPEMSYRDRKNKWAAEAEKQVRLWLKEQRVPKGQTVFIRLSHHKNRYVLNMNRDMNRVNAQLLLWFKRRKIRVGRGLRVEAAFRDQVKGRDGAKGNGVVIVRKQFRVRDPLTRLRESQLRFLAIQKREGNLPKEPVEPYNKSRVDAQMGFWNTR
eukprot:jgi/Mesvir1/11371/Mv10271-RA.1